MSDDTPALQLSDIARGYVSPAGRLPVLEGVNLTVAAGEIVGLVAPSGAGKSTLLHVAGLLDRPDRGAVRIAGTACETLDDRGRTAIRREKIGFVYQFHHLLAEFTAIENAAMPLLIAGMPRDRAMLRAQELLDTLGVGERAAHRPAEMSGGEQQRVAIARAFANRPGLLLADEPTGNLDQATAARVFDSLLALSENENLAALIVTHNHDLAARMDRVIHLQNRAISE